MKKSIVLNISVLVLSSLFILSNSFGNCHSVLRLNILKKLKMDSHIRLYHRSDLKEFDRKKKALRSILLSYGSRRQQLKSNRTEAFRNLKIFLKSNLFDRKFRKAVKVITHSIYDPKLLNEWADNLYRQLVLETYASGDTSLITAYEQNGELSRDLAIKLIAHRSIEGGFDGEIEVVNDFISLSKLDTLFSKKRIFIEHPNYIKSYGQMIYALQTDFIIFALKNARLNPNYAAEVLSWVGRTKNFYLPKAEDDFVPIYSVWSTNFESYDEGLMKPETFTIVFNDYFNWK